ncbi:MULTISPECIES: glycosyltransferase family 4 protein [Bacillus amyloliquefaciens group]|uniref:glycosyltransferase family 4 protein n=1 Tax=Bacillus amyloliquefaciens group TaxID=1938374 RepID=UPI000BA76DA6|nr:MULTISPECIES: glycosyltransferase family 4 protein [Bacillus amyloliquefaciens group]MCR4365023.1 glycosyltransferase family 4 protein [Bacillus amyloliquefaciens]MCV3199103.1 glycosyltransferase family 4 protein [Bacillus velezensis]MDP1502744.1 glycosyltransferase family 4 protein [Bacillus velezensis]MDP1506603.1 glycosyltransferase family 4 protein [Bacillus velezensis]MDW0354328.1 glycosyltransferase [Bacillus velezensis]
MTKKVLFCATVDYHFKAFHLPYFQWFQDMGWEVHVAAGGNMNLPFVDEKFSIPIRRSPFHPENLSVYRRLKRLIQDNGYDMIHCHTPVGGVLARLAARQARQKGTKVLYTAHGFHFCDGAPLKNWLLYYPIEKFLSSYTDCLITINEEDYERAKQMKKTACGAKKIHGIGVNTDRFRPVSREESERLREKHGFGAGEFILVYPAELNGNKNQGLLIETAALLKNRIPELKLVFAGEGVMEAPYRKKAESLGVSDMVRFYGFCRDIHELIQLADLSVASSIREGLGMNLLEGMAAEKPAVAADNRGHREIIEDGVNGFLVPAGDSAAFADRIEKLYRSPCLRKAMGQEGRRTAECFSETRTVKEMAHIYAGYMDKKEKSV